MDKWYNPKRKTGWKKDMPQEQRMQKMLAAHHGDKLSAGRALHALANVTQDEETASVARHDAEVLFAQHRNELESKKSVGSTHSGNPEARRRKELGRKIPRITPPRPRIGR